MLQRPKQRRKGHQAMAEKVGRFCVVSICTDICKHICCSLCQRNHCLEAALHHRTRQQDCFTLFCCRATAEEVFQTKFLASRLYTVACLGMAVLNPENFMHCCGCWDCYISSRVDYQLLKLLDVVQQPDTTYVFQCSWSSRWGSDSHTAWPPATGGKG